MGRGARGSDSGYSGVPRQRQAAPQDVRQTATAACNAIFSLGERADTYISGLDASASRTPAGRGGRLMTACNDLIEAERLAGSASPADQRLAQTILDNALWHAGRLAAAHDKDGPFHQAISAVIERHVVSGVAAQLDTLVRREAITPQLASDLRPEAELLCREAYLGTGGSPRWAAVRAAARAAGARELLASADCPTGSPLAAVRDRTLADCEQWIAKANKFLGGMDSLGYQLSKEAASSLTRDEAIAAALHDPRARAANATFTQEMLDAHDQHIATELGVQPAPTPIATVSDARWLDQIMNYQAKVAQRTVGVDALHSTGFGLMFPIETAEQIAVDARAGRFSEVLGHEKVHSVQPRKSQGRVIDSEHELMELAWLEGSTQALTVRIARAADNSGHLRGPGTPSGAYGPWVALSEAAAALASPGEEREFLAGLSATPRNSRTAYVAHRLLGSDRVEDQLRLTQALLPISHAAEQRWDDPGVDQWARERAQAALGALRAPAAAAA